jgi:uracil-DNA glycosylase family 4
MTLELDTRQRAMLAAMGIKVWQAPTGAVPASQPLPPSQANVPASQRLATPTTAPPTADVATLKALPHGLGEMDWTALADAAAQCQACGLCDTRHRSVFSNASPLKQPHSADWLIITDPPSVEEERKGDVFVNTEGELFDAMLLALGMSRQAAADQLTATVVPVLKCRVPDTRNPLPEELQQCRAFLERQVALLQPQVIVAMGRWAVQSVLSATSPDNALLPLGKLRGQVHRFANTPLVVTYHPQSLLRTPLDKAKAWADLCLAYSLTRRP